MTIKIPLIDVAYWPIVIPEEIMIVTLCIMVLYYFVLRKYGVVRL